MIKKILKYIVCERVQYQDLQSTKHVKGWSDIDVIAISSDEICIIQTKSFAVFKSTVKESLASTLDYFKVAEGFVRKRYSA